MAAFILDYDENFYYNKKYNIAERKVLQRMIQHPLPISERISDVTALKALYPVFDSNNVTTCIDIVYKDLACDDINVFYERIEVELHRLLEVANYFLWIKSVLKYDNTLQTYFIVLAMLIKRDISTGGDVAPFVMRYRVLHAVIVKNVEVDKAARDYIYKINEIKERKRKTNTLDSFEISLATWALQSEAPSEDVVALDRQVREVMDARAKTSIVQLFRKLKKKMKTLVDKNKIRRASRKAIKKLKKILQKCKRIDDVSKSYEKQDQPSVVDEDCGGTVIQDSILSEGLRVIPAEAELQPGDSFNSPCIDTSDSTVVDATTHLSVDLPVTVEPSDPSDLSPYYSVQYYSDSDTNSDSEDESSNSDSSDYDSGFDGGGCEVNAYSGQDDDTSNDALIAALLAAFDEFEEEQEREEGDENTKVAVSCDTSSKDTSGAAACTVAENVSVEAKPKAKKSMKKSKVKVATPKDIEKAFKKLAIKK